jgi:hypothetical protein
MTMAPGINALFHWGILCLVTIILFTVGRPRA